MALIPALKIGIWNAWILQVIFYLAMFIPDIFLDKEARNRTKRMSGLAPFNKIEKILALFTHAVIMPFVFVYSIFLPLNTDSIWLYVGLFIFSIALVLSVVVLFNIASTPTDEPVTKGAFHISRNPMYLSGFLMFISVAISCASWIVLLCAVLWIFFWQIVLPTEEKSLLEKYGNSYRLYMKKTPRWIGIPFPPT